MHACVAGCGTCGSRRAGVAMVGQQWWQSDINIGAHCCWFSALDPAFYVVLARFSVSDRAPASARELSGIIAECYSFLLIVFISTARSIW